MPATTKRLDLRFGSFACSVQGFDDPVMPVQQVLRAIQHMLEETPELADAAISFDAGAVESLIEEVARRADLATDDVDITPGLVIVHRGEDRPAPAFEVDPEAEEPEVWTRPFTESATPGEGASDQGGPEADGEADGEADAGEDAGESAPEPEAAGKGAGTFVNLFAPMAAGAPGAAAEAPTSDEPPGAEGDPFAARLDRADADAPPRDIFAEVDETADSRIFADPMAPEGPGDEALRADRDSPFGKPEHFVADLAAAEPEAGDRWTTAGQDRGAQDWGAQDWGAQDGTDRGGDDQGAPVNLFAPAAPPADPGPDESRRSLFTELLAERTQAPPEESGPESAAGEFDALYDDEAEEPEPVEEEDGYTAAGLAEAAGAKTVPELMVAAAAWMVLLRGQNHFTRPEVMAVFDEIPGDHDKSLPARIRGFGRAVRDGQIIAVDDSQFGLSNTEFDRYEALL